MAWGVLQLLFATRFLPQPPAQFPELAYWFITLAAITWSGTAAAAADNAAIARTPLHEAQRSVSNTTGMSRFVPA